MPKFSSIFVAGCAICLGLLAVIGAASAQSRMPPDGSALAQTPPVDQRAKQFRALPKTQKRYYLHQGYKKHHRPY